MKKIMVILLATVILELANKAEAQGYGSISFNTFYNELSPYGRWVDDLEYGKVWIADAPGFEPYYNNGQWVYTSYGWTWASDYSWGWAPFHYGRWTYLPMWGWAWVPGYEWGPAWVGWCQQGGYYGWAPLSPGMGFNFSYHNIPINYWRFVPQQYIAGPAVRNHIIRADRNPNEFRKATVINNTQVNNNITYAVGPSREAVERITRQRIDTRPVAFTGTNEQTRVEPTEVSMYRPDFAPVNRAATNRPADLRRDDLQLNRESIENVPNKMAVKPLPNEQDARRQQFKKDNELKTAPSTTQWQDELRLQRAREQHQKEQQMRAQQEQRQQVLQQQNEQRQNELNQQQELLRQQVVEDQRRQQQQAVQLQQEQRQNEIRQQQEQRIQQKMMQQQQRQNDIRQQQVREAPMRPQRQTPVNQRPRSGKPNEN